MLLPKAALPLNAADIAISAIRGQGIYGTITGLSQQYGISRQKVYDIRDQGYSGINSEFECAAYKPQGSFTLEISEEDMKRAVIAMRVMSPSSIRDIVALLPMETLFPIFVLTNLPPQSSSDSRLPSGFTALG